MIKVGNYKSAAEVYISSDSKSFNFEAPYAEAAAIKAAFDTANVVEFKLAKKTVELYSPELRLIQMGSGDNAIVMFSAAPLPEDKTAEVDELKAQLEEAQGVIEVMELAIEELAGMIGEEA